MQRLCVTSGGLPATPGWHSRGLVERAVFGRLERRVGRARAGAAGHVYFVAAAGQRQAAEDDEASDPCEESEDFALGSISAPMVGATGLEPATSAVTGR